MEVFKMGKTKFSFFTLFLIILTIALPYTTKASPLDCWNWRNPLPQGNTLMKIEYLNGMFVAVGDSGSIITSTDGQNWTTAENIDWIAWNSNNTVILRDVTYGNGLFVAVGNDRTIVTSSDGVNWTIRSRAPNRSDDLYHVSCVNGSFYAASDFGVILTSIDGIHWVPVEADSQWKVNNKIINGNGVSVTVGYTGIDKWKNNTILYSPSGVTWTPVFQLGTHEYAIEYATALMRADGLFIVWGYASANGVNVGRVFVSSDGLTWTAHDFETPSPISDAAYGNGILVASIYGGGIMTSFDGLHWTDISLEPDEYIYDMSCGEGTFVAVGGNGAILASQDGVHWAPKNSSVTVPVPFLSSRGTYYLNSTAYGNSTFVVVGGYPGDFTISDNHIFTSTDGMTWTESQQMTGPLSHISYINNTFIALGFDGDIWTSPDGVNWSERNSGTTKQLSGVAYGNDVFVIVGSGGTILTSADTTSWTPRGSGLSSNDFHGITFANGIFLAVGNLVRPIEPCEFGECPPLLYPTIFTSADGIEWTQRYLGTPYAVLYDIVYGNNSFVAVGSRGTVITSYDGINWTIKDYVVEGSITSVVYALGTFVAVSKTHASLIITSADGVEWTFSSSPGSMNDITFGNNTFLAVGGNGLIIQTDFLSGACTATLSSDLSLHVPFIVFNDDYLWGNASCLVNDGGSVMCMLTNYGSANPSFVNDCEASVLSSDMRLHVPYGIYNNLSYHADFEHIPSSDGQMWFKLLSATRN
jgi:hypothetical protein